MWAVFPDSQLEERTTALQPAGYKTWPCLQLICEAEFNIWWCSVFFLSVAPFHLFKRCNVIGRIAVTMMWPKSSVGERTVRKMCRDATVYTECKSLFFRLCSRPILQGHWLVLTTSVWPPGHNCAHREQYTHSDEHAWDRWGDTVPWCQYPSCRGARILRSTHTCSHGAVSVINMHAQK